LVLGSLDADFRIASSEPNDFGAFFRRHPRIDAILFNGRLAERTFLRLVRPVASGGGRRFVPLPSTSPANAAMPFAAKLERWRGALEST
jgi:TDG/mug DNA glycosylase family protein